MQASQAKNGCYVQNLEIYESTEIQSPKRVRPRKRSPLTTGDRIRNKILAYRPPPGTHGETPPLKRQRRGLEFATCRQLPVGRHPVAAFNNHRNNGVRAAMVVG